MKAIGMLALAALCFCLQACEEPGCGCALPPLDYQLKGRWEWVKTVTPTRTLTPQPNGKRLILERNNNPRNGKYIAFYWDDSLQVELKAVPNSYQEDQNQLTFTEQYGSQYFKFYLETAASNGDKAIQISSPMASYSSKADTVRHYYRPIYE